MNLRCFLTTCILQDQYLEMPPKKKSVLTRSEKLLKKASSSPPLNLRLRCNIRVLPPDESETHYEKSELPNKEIEIQHPTARYWAGRVRLNPDLPQEFWEMKPVHDPSVRNLCLFQ